MSEKQSQKLSFLLQFLASTKYNVEPLELAFQVLLKFTDLKTHSWDYLEKDNSFDASNMKVFVEQRFDPRLFYCFQDKWCVLWTHCFASCQSEWSFRRGEAAHQPEC